MKKVDFVLKMSESERKYWSKLGNKPKKVEVKNGRRR